MKLKIGHFLLVLIITGSCSSKTYLSKSFDTQKNDIHSIAVLPLTCSMNLESLPKGFSKTSLKAYEKEKGFDVQRRIIQGYAVNRTLYNVNMQSMDSTSEFLEANAIDYKKIPGMNKAELCKLFQTDAVIVGSLELDETAKTNIAKISLSAYAKTGKLLWKNTYLKSSGLNHEKLTSAAIQEACKSMPFKK
ncbi:MAG: hypothetical protein V4543_01710 [Bacteroidota bacterium]